MKHWEFLLQKEGDRSWLPLDSPDVEILEGRYRVVARSSRTNTQVQIRVSHLATDEHPPKRRIQKRIGQTNVNGLLVVMPFTRLQPGVWELSCASVDLMSDLVGDAWNYTVKLQVSAKDVEEEQWDPAWSPTSIESTLPEAIAAPISSAPSPATTVASPPDSSSLPPEVAEILGASMDRLFQIADQMSTQLIDEVLRDFDIDAVEVDRQTITTIEAAEIPPENSAPNLENSAPTSTPTESETGYSVPAGFTPVLRLDQEALIANRGEALTLSGRVELEPLPQPTNVADSQESQEESLHLTGTIPQELQLSLRDPQSLQVLVSDRQKVSDAAPPFSFSFSFSLPDRLNTHLILGEVLLCGILPDPTSTLATLTTQAFTVTVDPQQLVGELEKLSEALEETLETEEDSDRLNLPLELSFRVAKEPEVPSLELSFLEPEPQPETITPEAPPVRVRSLEGPLPPQIYRPDPEQARRMTVQLPDLAIAKPTGDLFARVNVPPEEPPPESAEAIADTGDQTQAEVEVSPEETVPNLAEPEAIAETVVEVDTTEHHEISAETEAENSQHEIEADMSDTPTVVEESSGERAVIDLPSPVQMEFQSLRLQDRFLHRLNSLANDAELSSWLRTNLYPGQVVKQETVFSSRSGKRVAEEIVVDDESSDNLPRRRRNGTKANLKKESPSEPNPLILPEDEPVPTPEIEIPAGELTAGKLISVRAKLPYLQPKIYVKLWIIDRQTRSILDGTRWLLDFYPNSQGELEATTQLNVPFGSLEVRFEAIAVEMHTQRESHKVWVDRSVIPPDLPAVSLDDFVP